MLNRRLFCKSLGILSGTMAIAGPLNSMMPSRQSLHFHNLYFKKLKVIFIGNPFTSKDYLNFIASNASHLELIAQITTGSTSNIPGLANFSNLKEINAAGLKPDVVLMTGHKLDLETINYALNLGVDVWTDRPVSLIDKEYQYYAELADQKYCRLLFAFVHKKQLNFMQNRTLHSIA